MPFLNEFTVNPGLATSATNFATIQAAVTAAPPGTLITVAPGTYAENVIVSGNGITLVSSGGSAATIITGTSAGNSLGTIILAANANNVTIGGPGSGFTINGFDQAPAGPENAAVYLQGAHNGVTLEGNELIANGEAALRSEGATIQNITVTGNTISGQTFTLTTDTPRGLVTLGTNGGSSSNITFTNNDVTGTSGIQSTGVGANLVTIDANNSTIVGNTFSGFTNGSAFQLRVREEETDIVDNTFVSPGGGSLGETVGLAVFEGPAGTNDGNTYVYNAGNDQVTLRAGDQIFDGGDGIDTIVLTSSVFAQVQVVDLTSGYTFNNVTGYDEVSNFENVVGSAQRDKIIGSDGDNVITASGGEDNVDGRGGSDTFNASNTNANTTADLGQDGYVSGAFTADLTNVENIRTGGGADTVYTSDADNRVTTGNGSDVVYASAGDDDFDLGAGSDKVVFDQDRDAYTITWDGTDAVVTQTASGDVTTVSNAGILEFADSKVILVDDASAEFSTIQSAVNAAADGDEIIVADGTYVEQVVIDGFTDLTLTASGDGVILQAPADVIETVQSSSGRAINAVLTVVDSTNVLIDGLIVDGNGAGNTVSGTNADFVGVMYRNASGELLDVTIAGIRDPNAVGVTVDGFNVLSGAQRGVGVQVDNDSQLDFTMTGGVIKNAQDTGMVFDNANLDISGVTISGGGAQPNVVQTGIQVMNSTGTITGNTIISIGFAGAGPTYSTQILASGNTDLDITDNTLTGPNGIGVFTKVVGIVVNEDGTPNSGGEISGNAISFVDTGIEVSGDLTPKSILIENNTITDLDLTDPDPQGVVFKPNPALDVDHNVQGSNFADILSGGAGNDTFSGLQGDDRIEGGGGQDSLTGGDGNDTFVYSDGAAMAAGETVTGGAGNDTILFASTTGGTLVLTAEVTGVEVVQISTTGPLNSTNMNINASAVTNGLTINGNDANNIITGTAMGDVINGEDGADTLNGGNGDDTLNGGAGIDELVGGAGDDLLDGGTGADILNGSDGNDTATYINSILGVTVNLTQSEATGGDAEGDTLANIENLIGSNVNDNLTGDEEANKLTGRTGDDTLSGAEGNDTLDHGAGDDSIDGGTGTDTVIFNEDWDQYTITRTGTTYTISYSADTDTVTGVEKFVFNGVVVDVTSDPDVIVTAIAPTVADVEEGGIDEDEDSTTIEISEGEVENLVVAIITAEDQNLPAGDELTFELVDEVGAIYVGDFTITKSTDTTAEITATGTFDFLAQPTFELFVRIKDKAGNEVTKTVTVNILDVNDPPTDIAFGSNTTVAEASEGAVITTVLGIDPNAGDELTYSVDDARFEVVFDVLADTFVLKLKAGAELDFEAAEFDDGPTLVVNVTVTDSEGETFAKPLTITVTNVNEAPGGGAGLSVWTPDAVQTGLRRAVLFPEAVVVDPEDDTLTYTFTSVTAGTLYLGDVAVITGQALTKAEFESLTYEAPAEGTYGAVFSVTDGTTPTPLNVTLNVSAAVNDDITGDDTAQVLDGGAGNDTIRAGDGADTVYGGSGDDVLSGGTADDIVYGNDGKDVLRGNLGNDSVEGAAGDDLLVGDAGNDTMLGGSGRDILRGGNGADFLDGGTGRDTMAGGKGADVFVFNAPAGGPNADEIRDFRAGADQIALESTLFAALGSSVKSGEFRFGTSAQDANDHLIYDKATGNLYYDANGSGNGGRKLIAILADDTNLTFSDFDII